MGSPLGPVLAKKKNYGWGRKTITPSLSDKIKLWKRYILNKVFKEFQSKQNETAPIATGNKEWNNNVKDHLLILPYNSSDKIYIISSMHE